MNYDMTYGATAYLTFDKRQIALTAEDIKKPVFIYHAESFNSAVSLGTLENAIPRIGGKVGNILGDKGADNKYELENKIRKEIESVQKIEFVGPAVQVILGNDLVITDFVINTQDKVYEFGLGLRFIDQTTGESKYKLGPVSFDGISVLVKAREK